MGKTKGDDNMTTAQNNLYKALILRCKAFKDSKETKCQLVKYHWFNRFFKAFEFEIDLNNFNEAQKLCKDTVIFIKDEEAEKITKILMSIL